LPCCAGGWALPAKVVHAPNMIRTSWILRTFSTAMVRGRSQGRQKRRTQAVDEGDRLRSVRLLPAARSNTMLTEVPSVVPGTRGTCSKWCGLRGPFADVKGHSNQALRPALLLEMPGL
jgi:hypothetical protein